jgi:hypothetical protein
VDGVLSITNNIGGGDGARARTGHNCQMISLTEDKDGAWSLAAAEALMPRYLTDHRTRYCNSLHPYTELPQRNSPPEAAFTILPVESR